MKGFLIVDGSMNTYVLPFENDVSDIFQKYIDVEKVHKNKTLKELDKDIRFYLKGGYVNE